MRELVLGSELLTPQADDIIFQVNDYTNSFISIIEGEVKVETDDGKSEVKKQCEQAIRQGVAGVPFFTFDGKHSFSGAQPAEVFTSVLDSLGS